MLNRTRGIKTTMEIDQAGIKTCENINKSFIIKHVLSHTSYHAGVRVIQINARSN